MTARGPLVTIRGRGEVPVGTVWALGRNYAAHAREMGASTEPVVFIKPATAVLPGGGDVPWPAGSGEVHHEVELVLRLGRGGHELSRVEGRAAIDAVALGIDLTARDLQAEAKKRGAPWARAKGFPGSAPVSEFVPMESIGRPFEELDLAASVGDEPRQSDTAASMIRRPGEIVALLSEWFELAEGDLVFTGTPAGVGPLRPGETILAVSRALGVELRVRMGSVRRP